MAQNMDPAMVQNLMQRFGGMMGGGGAPQQPHQKMEPEVGEVCKIFSLS